MIDASDQLPLGHDGYLKLWALSDPIIAANFILLDEAQNTNPVVLDVLRKQSAQIVYVGDKYQQIYEWRGAVNAMEKINTDATTLLTKSFMFGEAIADAASRVLAFPGEKVPIVGNSTIDSRIGPTNPRTILARTNATTITALIEALDIGLQPHLVGGDGELKEMLRGVQDLKRGKPSIVQDFFGFQNWKQVVEFAKSGEGEHLLTFVNLVESRGEKQLMWALDRTVDEQDCDIIISTAHKAKGREWSKVRLTDDFLKSQPRRRGESDKQAKTNGHDPAELRLFYVAMTRAREEIEIASTVMPLIGMTAPAFVPLPLTPRPSAARTQAGRKPNAPTAKPAAQRTEWTPPKNWEPEPPSDRPTRTKPPTPQQPSYRTERVDTPQPPKKKGILGWLFGK